jgi:antitoxin component YwqK of YwqJK toxin-antitoxin module
MKKFLSLILVSFFLFSCNLSESRVLKSELKKEAGLIYYQSKPYTGIAFSMWDEKNVKLEIRYKDGELNGISTYYFEDGSINEEINFKKGYYDGVYKGYYKDGHKTKFENEYAEGKRVGIWKNYYEDGKISSEVVYKDELPSSIKSYYNNGQLKCEENLVEGKVIGKRVIYFENGVINEIGNYVDGSPVGNYKIYDENGNIISDEKASFLKIRGRELKHTVKKY